MTSITKPEFVVSLFVFHDVLGSVHVLSKYLQSKDATLGRASEVINGVINSFEEKRNEFEEVWNKIDNFAKEHDISLQPCLGSRRRQQPGRMDNYVTESTVGKGHFPEMPSHTEPLSYWKINVFYPVMDNVTGSFKRRFENIPLAKSVDGFLQLDVDLGKAFVAHYEEVTEIDTSVLKAEVVVVRNILKGKSAEPTLEKLKSVVNKDFAPNLYRLLQVAIGLPVSSAGCERSFSAMRRIMTWLRMTMDQDRFSYLAILSIEREIVKQRVTAERVLNVFAGKNRKLKLI